MKYYQIFSPDEYWFLYCSQEEIARLQLDTHLLRNREKWENPKPIQLYIDTNVPDHEQLDFNEPYCEIPCYGLAVVEVRNGIKLLLHHLLEVFV